jgi:hypothetical protein
MSKKPNTQETEFDVTMRRDGKMVRETVQGMSFQIDAGVLVIWGRDGQPVAAWAAGEWVGAHVK